MAGWAHPERMYGLDHTYDANRLYLSTHLLVIDMGTRLPAHIERYRLSPFGQWIPMATPAVVDQ